MTNISSRKLFALGLGFFGLALVLLALYFIQYSLAYKNIFRPSPIVTQTLEPVATNKNFNLNISKISVDAPIIVNIDGNNEAEYLSALEKGVAQLRGSAIPGQPGNSFIFGHSSYYFYAPGAYKSIFANLSGLEIGDEIIIRSGQDEYRYQVYEKRTVNPDNVEITKNIPGHPETLTLMTCTPTGTTLKRLIVFADKES